MNCKSFVLIVIFPLFVGLNRRCAAAAGEKGKAGDAALVVPTKQEALAALRKAAEFYATKVATEAGYHPVYTVHLSSRRSGRKCEWQISGNGPQTVQQATPTVGMAFLVAWEATGDRYFLKAAQKAAHGMLRGQMCSGGWDERVTELDPVKRKDYRFRADGDCSETEAWIHDRYEPHQTGDKQVEPRRNMTNMDNNITQSVVRMLMRVDRALNFEDRDLHEAVLHALDYLVLAQYAIGAWPRNYEKLGDPDRFPVMPASYPDTWSRTWTRPAFYSYYNINDDCTLNVMDAMLEAARIYNEPRYRASAEKAGVFLILAQMPDPQPAWAQQYDRQMQPSWARSMEPPAISGRESVSVLQALLTLYRETAKKRYLEPIPRALEYLKNSSFERNGKRVLARFYELKTNRPLYITPGSPDVRKITYSAERIKRGYSFFASAEPLETIAEEYKQLLAAKPETLRRPEKLTSLKPFTHRPPPPLSRDELTAKVRAVISSLDARGAWLEPYVAGRNTTPPAQRLISSGTFARNMSLLSDYLVAGK
ncbi:MAG: pectate lyase [Planctomycetota bacterium]|jgi:PelA/Pel-15E family pectate lyase